jgi:hypothetical protein
MPRSSSHAHAPLVHRLACVVFALLLAHPGTAAAQGFPGGMSGGMGGRGGYHGGGRGERGGRGDRPRDSTSATRRENTGTLADIALRHRTELELTDSQSTALAGVAERARIDRMNAVAALASLRDSASTTESSPPPSDSSRLAILQRRRALAAALAQLHDVDVSARTATLALLSATQQSALVKFEGADGAGEGERSGSRGEARGESSGGRPRDQ